MSLDAGEGAASAPAGGVPIRPGPDDPGAGRRAWRWALIAIFAVALVIRVPPLFAVSMWYDEAVEGLMSQDVLRGRFPIFFYGQPVHGVADRYLTALVLPFLGPTPVALKVPMLALYFAFLASTACTARVIFGRRVAGLAALLVAVPPYYFFGWNFDSRGHYALMLLLGVWLLYLAWRVGQEGVAAAPPRRFVGLGLLAGLAGWTNYLSLTFLAPVALSLSVGGLLGLRRQPRAVLLRAALASGGFVVGIVPVLGYYLGHGVSLRPPGSAVGAERAASHAVSFVVDALPPTLGVHPAIWGPAYGAAYAAVGGLTLAAVLYSAGWWLSARRRGGAGGGTVGLLLGVVVLTALLSVLTKYGAILRFPRYLLPLTLALPLFLALLLERVGTVSVAAKWLLVAGLVLNNLLGSLTLTPVLAAPETVAQQRNFTPHARAELTYLERHGFRHLYGGRNHWPFLSDRRFIVSDPYRERMAEFVREVDAAERATWIFGHASAAFERSAEAAGIRFRRLIGLGFFAYTDFALPETGYADLDPAAWSATASPRPEDAALAHDGSLETVWRTQTRQAPGQYYQLDLGGRHRIGLLAWMPWKFQEVPVGFRVAVSGDARAWQEVADVPDYLGPLYWSGTHPFQRVRRARVEVRFSPVEARHVRIELTAPGREFPWSMREVAVGTPAGDCPRRFDPGALVDLLRRRGVRTAYADHWISANIARLSGEEIRVLPSNLSVNSYRLERPSPDTIEPVRPRPGRAIVVEDCPAEVGAAVARLLDESGVSSRREAAGGFVAFTGLQTRPYAGAAVVWRRTEAGRIEVRLDEPRRVGHLVVQCLSPVPGPRGAGALAVETLDDSGRWQPLPVRVVRRGTLRMSGSRLFRDGVTELVVEGPLPSPGTLRLAPPGGGGAWCPVKAVRVGPAA